MSDFGSDPARARQKWLRSVGLQLLAWTALGTLVFLTSKGTHEHTVIGVLVAINVMATAIAVLVARGDPLGTEASQSAPATVAEPMPRGRWKAPTIEAGRRTGGAIARTHRVYVAAAFVTAVLVPFLVLATRFLRWPIGLLVAIPAGVAWGVAALLERLITGASPRPKWPPGQMVASVLAGMGYRPELARVYVGLLAIDAVFLGALFIDVLLRSPFVTGLD